MQKPANDNKEITEAPGTSPEEIARLNVIETFQMIKWGDDMPSVEEIAVLYDYIQEDRERAVLMFEQSGIELVEREMETTAKQSD